MQPRIRKLTADDELFLWTALYYALHRPPGSAPLPPEVVRRPELARYVSRWTLRPGDLGFVAEIHGEPVGAAWARCWSSSERGYGFVDQATPELSIALLPGHRGRGIGTALFERLLAEAAREAHSISLSVSESNAALRLYERLGFVVVGRPEDGSITMFKRFSR